MAVVVSRRGECRIVTKWSAWLATQWAMENMDTVVDVLVRSMKQQRLDLR
jgi:hypothetical protein